jgi:hypothetical protein
MKGMIRFFVLLLAVGLLFSLAGCKNPANDTETGGTGGGDGISLAEYDANKSNLANAKVEYSAMATYGQGKKFRAEISPAYTGDFYYKVTNGGRIGMELRKDSPDGEKIGYLPALATNYALYSNTSNDMTATLPNR